MEEEMRRRQQKNQSKNKSKKGKGKIIALVILLIIAITAAAGVFWWKTSVKPPEIPVEPADAEDLPSGVQKADGIYSVLVVGTDKVGLNTDTIFVASFDTINDKINVMSIPRDTMSANVSRTVKKINAAYSVGGKANMDNLKKEIKALIGFTPNYYVVVNLDAFAQLIDAIGGVKIDVPRDMDYEDPYQNLSIHIKKGEQVLNGQDAIGFVRYRKGYVEGDLGRVKAQQQFMTALAQQLAQPSTLTKLPKIADIINKNMQTDLTASEILWFGQQAVEVDIANDLQMFVLPGEAHTVNSLSYYIPSTTDILEIVNGHFNPYDKAITKLDTVSLSSIRAQAAEQAKKTDQTEKQDPEVQKEQEQENSDIAGESTTSDTKPTNDGETSQKPTVPEDSVNPSDSTDVLTPEDPSTTPIDTTDEAINSGGSDSSGVVLNEFGQPYVPEDNASVETPPADSSNTTTVDSNETDTVPQS